MKKCCAKKRVKSGTLSYTTKKNLIEIIIFFGVAIAVVVIVVVSTPKTLEQMNDTSECITCHVHEGVLK